MADCTLTCNSPAVSPDWGNVLAAVGWLCCGGGGTFSVPQEQHGAKGSSFVVRSMFGWGGGVSPGVWTLNGCWQTGMWRIDCQLVVLGALLEVCRQMKCEIIELDEAFSLYWGQSEGLMTFTTRPVDNSIDMHAHIHTATHSLFTMYSWWGLV